MVDGMNQRYFSQHGEDVLLERIFAGRRDGTFVEVGANDGITFSTTKRFEDLGWTCILVEPAPTLCKQIRRNRRSMLYECAASSEAGVVDFHYVEDGSLYSSVEVDSTMRHLVEGRRLSVVSIKVPKRRLDDVLEDSGIRAVDFLTIDVEGHELEALKGLTLERWSPKVVIVEDAKSDTEVTPVESHMRASGYRKFYRSGGNDWYARFGDVPWGMIMKGLLGGAVDWRGLIKASLPDAWRLPVMRFIRRRNHPDAPFLGS